MNHEDLFGVCRRAAAVAVWGIVGMALFLAAPAGAAESKVGSFVIIRGDAVVKRGPQVLKAGRKDPIFLKDIVETAKKTRAKMVFIDESMLTLGPDSRASIEQFVYSKEGGGASIFNLLEGKMRTIVGKTQFEVHTATSVAAARGTVIDFNVGKQDGRPFTRITCLRGAVDVRSADPNLPGLVRLGAGQEVVVHEGQPIAPPRIVPIGPARGGEAEGGDDEGTGEGGEGGPSPGGFGGLLPGMGGGPLGGGTLGGDTTATGSTETILPPVEQEPTIKTSPVTINVEFP